MESKYYKDGETYIKLDSKRYWIVSNYDGISLSVTRANFTDALNIDWGEMTLPHKEVTKQIFESVKEKVLLKLIKYN